MRTIGRWWKATGLVVAAAGCVGGEEPQAHQALLLLDQEAREAGFVVVGESVQSQALPIAVSVDEPVTLAGPEGAQQIEVSPGEILLVRGAGGAIERRVVGEDVDPDRLVLAAPAEIVAEVADGLGAEVQERDDGRVVIVAPGVLSASAGAPVLSEILEASVVELTTPAVRGATRSIARPSVRRAPTPVAPVAPVAAPVPEVTLYEEPLVLSAHDADYMDLPAAASCEDSVEGTWIARRYFPGQNDWYFFTMKIDRRRGDALQGQILAHSWRGGPSDTNTAQACGIGGEQWVVAMPAKGRVRDGRIEFGGTDWNVAEHTCGWAPGPGEYNLDRFSGAVSAEGEATWQNDDGGRMVGEPFEFRRISCDAR